MTRPSKPAGQRDLAGGQVQAHGPLAEPQVKVQVVTEAQPDAVGAGRPGQYLLGQRRPLVRGLSLRADQGDPAVVAGPAQGARGAQPGNRGAHDEHLAQ